MNSRWELSILLILGMLSGLSTASTFDESRLKQVLFSSYDKTAAPETPLLLTYSITPHRVIDVNPDKGLITVDIILSHTWQDIRLAWDPNEFNATGQSIVVPRGLVFLPDMELQNGFATELVSDPEVIIHSGGKMTYVPYVRAEVYCDLPSRPFEGHICDVRIGPWFRTSRRITIESFEVDDSSLLPGGRCTLGQSQATVNRQVYLEEVYESAIMSLNVSCLAPESKLPVTKVNVTCELVNPASNSAIKSYVLFPYFFLAPMYIMLLSLNMLLG